VLVRVLALIFLTSSAAYAVEPADDVEEFLTKHIGLSEREIARIAQGEHVTKVLDTNRDDEVAVFGVIWFDVPIAFFLDKYRDIESFEQGDNVEGIGMLSDPPRLEDFDRLSLPADDIKDIKKCKPGKCNVKLGEAEIERFQSEVDWSAPDAEEQANALARQLGLELVQAYRQGGNDELGAYRDKKQPQLLAEEFRGLLENSPYLPEYNPELHTFLNDYPDVELPNSSDFMYWSRVKFGLKPLVRLNHVVIHRDSDDDGAEAAIASKQIYSSHYFRAALELRFLVKDRERPDAEGFYLMSVNRARADGLTGFTGRLLRGTIKDRTRKGLESFLVNGKRKLEQQYRAQQ
jgi:hypothetical protein